jgi:hypothetical protein
MTVSNPARAHREELDVANALDAAIRRAFATRFEEPVPPELQDLVDRVRALEARVRRAEGNPQGSA